MDFQKKLTRFFQYNNYSNEFLKYGVWLKRMKHVLGKNISNYEIKKIFTNMVNESLFNKKKNIKRSYLYQFNKGEDIFNLPVIISFD